MEDVLANFSLRVKRRSATPWYCVVSADVNSRLMSFPTDVIERSTLQFARVIRTKDPRNTNFANASEELFKSFRCLGFTPQVVFPHHLVLSSRNMMAYCSPPLGLRGFLPLKSTNFLPRFLSDLFRVVFGTEALMPFAEEHPKYGRSLTPGLRDTSLFCGFPQ